MIKSITKWTKRIATVLACLLLVAIPVVIFGGKWVVEKYLRDEIKVGQGHVRLPGAKWHWSLELAADSLYYWAPGIKVQSGRAKVSANLFRSFLRFSPSVDLALDTLELTLLPQPDSAAKPVRARKDSLAFPNFKLPASIKIAARRMVIADDSGFLASLSDVKGVTGGSRSMTLEIDRIHARQLDTLALGLRTSLDWAPDTAVATITLLHGPDRINFVGRLPKANIFRGDGDLHVRIASSKAYASLLRSSASLLIVHDLDFRAKVSMGQFSEGHGYRLMSSLHAGISGFDPAAPYRLGPQVLDFKFDFRDSVGAFSFASQGKQGENILLQGNLQATHTDSLGNAAWLARHMEGSLRGHVQDIRIAVGGRLVKTNLRLTAPRLGPTAAIAEIITGEGSRIAAELRKETGGWSGKFSAKLMPGERWVRAFTDTNVVFKSLSAGGTVKKNSVAAVIDVRGLKAYGVLGDSIHLVHRYGPAGYDLMPSYWHQRGVVWKISGRADTHRPEKMVIFRMSNFEFGSLDFRMPRQNRMEAHIDKLAIDQLPYRGLDSLASKHPRLTADFNWDRAARTGEADIFVTGTFLKEKLVAKVKAKWDKRRLEVPTVIASLGVSTLKAGGSLDLKGRQFYEVTKLDREDYKLVFLEANKFDLAKALRTLLPQPPLLSGVLDGRLDYSDSAGFRGRYTFADIQPARTVDLVAVKQLTLEGNGDGLIIRALTVSKQEPLLNDSVYFSLSGVLAPNQEVAMRIAAGRSLFFDLQGRMRSFKDLQAGFGLTGGITLPGKTGEIQNLRAHADLNLVFKTGLAGLKLDMDTLAGRYIVVGLDTQVFSAPLHIRNGKLAMSSMTIKGKGGELAGTMDYALTGTKALSARLQGGGLVAQLGPGDKIRLRDVRVEVHMDSTLLTFQASVGQGSAEHIKSPMRAAGDFSRLAILYRAPMGKAKTGVYGTGDLAFLKVHATLDSSTVRYRMRSFETMQNLFKRGGDKHALRTQSTRPMQVQIRVETAGIENSIDTDILRFNYVGDFSMNGIYPYALVQGRINSSKGQLGTKAQAYKIERMEIKWLNSTLEEGTMDLEARKKLARNCEAGTSDSCIVINRLGGQLSQLQFSYDTDCGGTYGAGADVAALVYSVRRGCYSTAFAGGGSGLSYQEQALALLEPLASDYLSRATSRLSGNWIAQTRITGLGALATGKRASTDTSSATQAIALEVISKEFWRTRLSMRSYYRSQQTETDNPWAYRMAMEWRPPLAQYIQDPKWKKRVKNNVSLDASIYTDTTGTMQKDEQQVGKRLGLNFTYDFWVQRWAKKQTVRELLQEGRKQQVKDSIAAPVPYRVQAQKPDSSS